MLGISSALQATPLGVQFLGAHYGVVVNIDGSLNLTTLGLQEGDLVFITHGVLASWSYTGASGGFTFVGAQQVAGTSLWITLPLAYKIMGSTPDTSASFTGSGAGGTDSMAFAFRGVDQSSPLDGVTPVGATFTGGSSPNPPSITSNTDGALIVCMGTGITAATPPSGMEGLWWPGNTGSDLQASVAQPRLAGNKNYGAWPTVRGDAAYGDAAWSFVIKPEKPWRKLEV